MLGIWRTLPTPVLVVVIVDYRGGWTENVLWDALFFSLLGTNQKCLMRHKWFQHRFPNRNEKKCLLCFKVHVFHSRELSSTRRWAIGSDGVARLGEISLFLIMILCAIWHLQPGTALNLRFMCFSPKRFSASLRLCEGFSAEPKWVFCHIWSSSDLYNNSGTPMASSAPCGGYCLSALK